MAKRWGKHGGFLCILMQGLLVLPALPAAAQDSLDRWGGSLGFTTDYIRRGVSQTGGAPAFQGGFQYQSPAGWTAGVWGSSVDFAAPARLQYELDLHVSYAWALDSDWAAQIGAVHYYYPEKGWADYDYDELSATLAFQQRITATIAWSPNAARYGNNRFVQDEPAIAYELALLEPLGSHWSLCVGVGHYDLRDLLGDGYWFWNAGVAFKWQELQFDFLHINTDSTAYRMFGHGGSQWTAALSWRF
jgi:uncharacterized protein (TIGR02001 family)